MRSRILAMAATSVLAAGAALSPASPAAAVPTACALNYICFFDKATDSSPFDAWPVTYGTTCLRVTPDNIASYVIDNSNYDWKVFHSTDCSGEFGVINDHSSGYMSVYWNNTIGSTKRNSLVGVDVAGPSAYAPK